MNAFLKTMNAYLASSVVAPGLGALLALNPAHAATTNTTVPIQVFLVNLSPSAISSVSWTAANGSSESATAVPSGSILALGAMSVPVSSQTGSIVINQTAANGSGSAISTSFTLGTNCGWEPYQQALARGQINPSSWSNVSPVYSYTSLVPDFEITKDGAEYYSSQYDYTFYYTLDNQLTGTNVYMVCTSNNNQYATTVSNSDGTFSGTWPGGLTVNYPTAYSSNFQPVVLGSYVPTGQSWDTSAAPAFYNLGTPPLTLSPTGLTTYIGTSVVVPANGTDFSYWPVTIYYGVDSGGNSAIPLVAPTNTQGTTNSTTVYFDPTTAEATSPADAVNVPAYFTNFQDSGVESAYMMPNAGNYSVNGLALPMPCWPVFDTSNTFTGCNGSPQYVSNGTTTAASNTLLSKLNGLVGTVASLITLVAVF